MSNQSIATTIPRDSSISNLADTISSLEKQVAQMTSEKDDLLVKIEAGEGANTALTQLKQENEGLAERLQSANQGGNSIGKKIIMKILTKILANFPSKTYNKKFKKLQFVYVFFSSSSS